jgi:hypothetical protein
MKLFLKILFFEFAIFQVNISEAKMFVFDAVVSEMKITVDNVERKNESTIISENEIAITCKSENDLVDYSNLRLGAEATAAKGGGNAFRYMSQAELEAVQSTGLLRGGRAGETFFTKDLYKSATSAQNRLALPGSPALRVEFQILNNPTLLRNGTKVLPANGMMGRGAEFMTLDPVKVRLINWQTLR